MKCINNFYLNMPVYTSTTTNSLLRIILSLIESKIISNRKYYYEIILFINK